MALPKWLTGPGGLYAIVVTPQTNTNGTLADTTPVATLTGNLKRIGINGSKTVENIMAMDAGRRNNVVLDVGTEITLVEILKYNGTNLLATAYWGSSDYHKVAITRGGQAYTFYGVYQSYDETLEHGESVGVGVFVMVDNGAANPGYA